MTRNDYNRCVDDYADAVYRFVLKNLRDKDMARDIVQETFTKIWLKHDEIEADKSKSYLFTSAYHTMIDTIRKEDRIVRLEPLHQAENVSYNSYSDLKEVLDDALAQLPEIQRTVVLLRDYEGYRYDEIGEITGLSEAQVKVYIFRARMSLKAYIQSMDKVLEVH